MQVQAEQLQALQGTQQPTTTSAASQLHDINQDDLTLETDGVIEQQIVGTGYDQQTLDSDHIQPALDRSNLDAQNPKPFPDMMSSDLLGGGFLVSSAQLQGGDYHQPTLDDLYDHASYQPVQGSQYLQADLRMYNDLKARIVGVCLALLVTQLAVWMTLGVVRAAARGEVDELAGLRGGRVAALLAGAEEKKVAVAA